MLGEMGAASVTARKPLWAIIVAQTASAALPILGNALRPKLKALAAKARRARLLRAVAGAKRSGELKIAHTIIVAPATFGVARTSAAKIGSQATCAHGNTGTRDAIRAACAITVIAGAQTGFAKAFTDLLTE